MLINTNGFEIGDEIYAIRPYGNGKGKILYAYDKQTIWSFHYYDDKDNLYIETREENYKHSYKYCFKTKQEAIDYCSKKNYEELNGQL